jgi:hypothetical protein
MKAKEFMQKILSNKYVLMGVTVLAVVNLIGYMSLYDFESVIYFILVGCVTFFFSKNMIIVFGVPLILVNLFRLKSREGMENTDASVKPNNDVSTNQFNDPSTKKFKDVLEKVHLQKASSQQGLPITPLPTTNVALVNTDTSDPAVDESFEVGRSKKNSNGYNIDYASTIEDAYDKLM